MSEYEESVFEAARKTWGDTPQIEMLNEEATELALAVRKYLRKGTAKEFENLAEEMADVEICIEQMKMILPRIRAKVAEYRQAKVERLEKRVQLALNTGDFVYLIPLTEMSGEHFDMLFTKGFAPALIKTVVDRFSSLHGFHTAIASYGEFDTYSRAAKLGYDVEFKLSR